MDEVEEKQATSARRKKKPTRRETASSVPEEMHPKPGPIPIDTAAEIPHRPDTAPAEIGTLPEDRYPTPQPGGAQRVKSHEGKEPKARRRNKRAARLERPSGPPPDNLDPAPEQDDTKGAPSKASDDDPDPPKEIIDLTIKEESCPGTPIPPQAPKSNEGPTDLKAGWVRFSEVLAPDVV